MTDYCTFYIVRHGETDWNLKGIVQGQTDTPLNQTGEDQAQKIGKQLKEIHFDRAFSSDLIRAKRTAEIITLERDIVLETTAILRERNFGDIEGKSGEIFKELDKQLEALSDAERAIYKFDPNYETDADLVNRFTTFLREAAVGYADKKILVVSHGGMIRALVDKLVGQFNPKRKIGNAALLVLESDGVDFLIKEAQNIDL